MTVAIARRGRNADSRPDWIPVFTGMTTQLPRRVFYQAVLRTFPAKDKKKAPDWS